MKIMNTMAMEMFHWVWSEESWSKTKRRRRKKKRRHQYQGNWHGIELIGIHSIDVVVRVVNQSIIWGVQKHIAARVQRVKVARANQARAVDGRRRVEIGRTARGDIPGRIRLISSQSIPDSVKWGMMGRDHKL